MFGSRWCWSALVLLLSVALAVPALGAGFQTQENGAKAMGLSNAFTGTADDPSGVYYNPAAIARYGGIGGQLSLTLIDVHARHKTHEQALGMANQHTGRQPIIIPALFGVAAWDQSDSLRFGLGMGTFTPFGLSIKWGKGGDWGGRYHVTESAIETITPVLNGSVEFDIAEGTSLALSAGVSVLYGSIMLERKIDFASLTGNPNVPDGLMKLDLHSHLSQVSPSWNVATMLRLFDNRVRLGFTYRHSYHNIKLEGRASLTNIPNLGGAEHMFSTVQDSSHIWASLPNETRLGVAVDVTKELTLSFDWRWTNWSMLTTFRVRSKVPALDNQILEFRYHDASYLALGSEYRLMNMEDHGFGIAIRAGGFWDQTPVRDRYRSPMLPDDDRWGFSLGAGFEPVEGLTIDLAYMGVYVGATSVSRDIPTNSTDGVGRYYTWANLFSLSVGLKF